MKNSAQSYTLTQLDGRITQFGWPSNLEYKGGKSGFCSTVSQGLVCALLANTTTYPSGQVITRNWKAIETCVPYVVGGEPLYDNCAHFFRLSSIQNRNNYKISFAYQNNTDPTSGSPASAWYVKTSATFSNTSDASITRTATYAYPSGTVTDLTDTGGGAWKITRVNGVTLASIRKPGRSVDDITMSANVAGIVSSITNHGVTTTYNYTTSGNTATMVRTDAAGKATTIVSDLTIGLPTSIMDALGGTTRFKYDASRRLTHVVSPEGTVNGSGTPTAGYTKYTYDSRSNVTETRIVSKTAGTPPDIVTTAGYDASCTNVKTCNQPNWTKDELGKQTDYTYDPNHGGVLTVTAPAPGGTGTRPQTRYSYTQVNGMSVLSGTSTCQTTASCANTADEVKTSTTYAGAAGNYLPVSSTVGDGTGGNSATTAVAYDAVGNVLTVDGPLAGTGDTVRYRYDALRRVTGVVGPDPDGTGARIPMAQRFTYAAHGGVSLVEKGVTSRFVRQTTIWRT